MTTSNSAFSIYLIFLERKTCRDRPGYLTRRSQETQHAPSPVAFHSGYQQEAVSRSSQVSDADPLVWIVDIPSSVLTAAQIHFVLENGHKTNKEDRKSPNIQKMFSNISHRKIQSDQRVATPFARRKCGRPAIVRCWQIHMHIHAYA